MSFCYALGTDADLQIFPQSFNGFVGVGIKQYLKIIQDNSKFHTFLTNYMDILAYGILIISAYFTLGFRLRNYLHLSSIIFTPLFKFVLLLFGKKKWFTKLGFLKRKKFTKKDKASITRKNRVTHSNLNNSDYNYPKVELLEGGIDTRDIERANLEYSRSQKIMLESVLEDFNIKGEIISVKPKGLLSMIETVSSLPGINSSTRTIFGNDSLIANKFSFSFKIILTPTDDPSLTGLIT